MAQVLLFDVADTLVWLWEDLVASRLSSLSGMVKEDITNMLRPSAYDGRGVMIAAFDLGEISEEEFFDHVCRELKLTHDLSRDSEWIAWRGRVAECFLGIFRISRQMFFLLSYLKEEHPPTKDGGFILGVLSNMNKFLAHDLLSTFPVLRMLENGGVFHFHIWSYEVGVAKPDYQIFWKAFEEAGRVALKLGIPAPKPDKYIFIDDRTYNLEAFAQMGGRTVPSGGADENEIFAKIQLGLTNNGVPAVWPQDFEKAVKITRPAPSLDAGAVA